MSRTAVIVALLVALVLGGVALVLTSKGGGGTGGLGNGTAASGPLLSFEPSKVTELRMEYPDGTFQSVQRDPVFDWKVVLGQTGTPARSWPAAVTQAQSAVRLLSNLLPDRPGDGSITKRTGTLKVYSQGAAEPATLTIGDQRLAGKVLVEVGGPQKRMAWIDAQFADMLVTTGPQAWRSTVALPGVGDDVSRITLKAQNGKTVALARVQGKWALREPLAAPVEPEEVTKLIAALSKVQIVDFCDKGAPTQTGLETPTATLWVETDARDSSGALTTIRQTLTVGQAADMSRQTLVARLDRTVTGKQEGGYSMVVIVSGEGLAAINTNAATYVPKRALQVAAEDIGMVLDGQTPGVDAPCRAAHRRAGAGWETQCSDADWRPATPDDVQRITELLELLTVTPAAVVTFDPSPAMSNATEFEFRSSGGQPLARVRMTCKDSKIKVWSGDVTREYPAGAGKLVSDALPVH